MKDIRAVPKDERGESWRYNKAIIAALLMKAKNIEKRRAAEADAAPPVPDFCVFQCATALVNSFRSAYGSRQLVEKLSEDQLRDYYICMDIIYRYNAARGR
jgi:hypothetical protein